MNQVENKRAFDIMFKDIVFQTTFMDIPFEELKQDTDEETNPIYEKALAIAKKATKVCKYFKERGAKYGSGDCFHDWVLVGDYFITSYRYTHNGFDFIGYPQTGTPIMDDRVIEFEKPEELEHAYDLLILKYFPEEFPEQECPFY